MTNKYSEKYDLIFDKYVGDDLFTNCTEISCPPGWEKLINQIYKMVKNFNSQHSTYVSFSQIKVKFNSLVVYLNPPPVDDDGNMIYDTPIAISYDLLVSEIEKVLSKSKKMCRICGKKTETIVYKTKIVEKCFDHFSIEQ